MNENAVTCDDSILLAMLHDELPVDETGSLLDHIETCAHCQTRVDELAASSGDWQRAADVLASQPGEPHMIPTLPMADWSEQPVAWNEAMAQQLLSPPSHPEMLGRLDRYEIERLIGVGGMGVVFKAVDTELNRPVAVKMLAPYLAGSGPARQRFSREARAAAAVVHHHVVPIHYVETDRDTPYIVMHYVAGESLQARIDREGALELCEILRIGMQVASGLSAAHQQGLVHRDIKPSNILLEDTVERALITDFGLARAADDASLTRTGFHPGTPQYMSPEQARGDSVDAQSDLFSLGSVLYTLCTGRPPFRAETPFGVMRRISDDQPTDIRDVNPQIPEWLCGIVRKLMSKDKQQRFTSASEVRDLLEECLNHVQQPTAVALPERLKHIATAEQSARGPSRSGWIAGGLALVAFLLAGIVYYIQTDHGTVRVEVLDESLAVTIKGNTVTMQDGNKQPLTLRPGEQKLIVRQGEVELITESFQLRRGDKLAFKAELLGGEVVLSQQGKAIQSQSIPNPPQQLAAKTPGRGSSPDAPKTPESKGPKLHAETFRVFKGHHDQGVKSLSFSPDGKMLASASQLKLVIHKVSNGEVMTEIGGAKGSVVFDPEGQVLAAVNLSGVSLWDVATGKKLRTFKAEIHPYQDCYGVAFSPDGQRLALGSERGLKVWDLKSGRELHSISAHLWDGNMTDVAFSPDGKQIASANWGGHIQSDGKTVKAPNEVKVWDAETGKRLAILSGGGHGVAFSPDGKRIASGNYFDGTASIWDIATEQELHKLRGHRHGVAEVAFSPDGKWLATAGRDNVVKIWNPNTGQEAVSLPGHESVVRCVTFSPDGKRLYSSSDDKTIRVWDIGTRENSVGEERDESNTAPVVELRWAASEHIPGFTDQENRGDYTGDTYYSLKPVLTLTPEFVESAKHLSGSPPPSGGRIYHQVAIKLNKKAMSLLENEIAKVQSDPDKAKKVEYVTLLIDGQEGFSATLSLGWKDGVFTGPKSTTGENADRVVASLAPSKPTELSDQPSIRLGSAPFRFGGRISSLEYSDDGKRLLAAGGVWGAAVWNAESGDLVRHFPGGSAWTTADFSPDGRHVALAGYHPASLPIWNVETGEQVSTLEQGTKAVRFSPDGKRAFTAFKHTLVSFDTTTGKRLTVFAKPGQGHVMFATPREGTLVAGNSGEDLRVWDWKTGEEVANAKVRGGIHNHKDLVFTPDGKSLIVYGKQFSKTVVIRAARTLKVTRTLELKYDPVSVNVSRDGRRLAVGTSQGWVHVFDLETGKEVAQWEAHTETHHVSAVALSPDGKRLACGTDMSGAVCIWDIATKTELFPAGEGHSVTVGNIAVLDDGTVMTHDYDRRFRRWNPKTGKATHFWKWPRPLDSAAEWILCPKTQRALCGFDSLFLCTDLKDPKAYVNVYDKVKPPTDGGRKKSQVFGNGTRIEALAMSADGRFAAAAHIDDRVVVCNLEKFEHARNFTLPEVKHLAWSREYSLALSPDGKLLAGASQNKLVLWEVATGKERLLPRNEFDVTGLAFSPDGHTLAIIGGRQVKLWSVKDEHIRRMIVDHDHGTRSVAFSPDSNLLATGGQSNSETVVLWDVVSGRKMRTLRGARGGAGSLAFAPDGQTIYAGTGSSLVVGWNLAKELEKGGNPEQPAATDQEAGLSIHLYFQEWDYIEGVTFHKASLLGEGPLKVYTHLRPALRVLPEHVKTIQLSYYDELATVKVEFTEDATKTTAACVEELKNQRRVVTALIDRTENGHQAFNIDPQKRTFKMELFFHDLKTAQRIVDVYSKGKRAWTSPRRIDQPKSNELEGTDRLEVFQPTPVPGLRRLELPAPVLDVSPDEQTVLLVDEFGIDNTPVGVPRIWSLATNRELSKLPALEGFYLRFVPGDRPLCIAGDHRRQQIRFWDIEKGAWHGDWIEHDLRGGHKPIFWPVFSPDGETVSIASPRGEMQFWKLRGEKPVEIKPPADKPLPRSDAPKPFYERQFSSDGKYCFANFDAKLYVLDPATATTVAGPFPHQTARHLEISWPSVLYNADSETLVTIESSDEIKPSTLRFRSAKKNWQPTHSATVTGKVGSVSFLGAHHVLTGGLGMRKAEWGGQTAQNISTIVPVQPGKTPSQTLQRDAHTYAFAPDGKQWVGMGTSTVYAGRLGQEDLLWKQQLPQLFSDANYITYQLGVGAPHWVVAQRTKNERVAVAAYSMKDGRLLLDKSGLKHAVHVKSTLAAGREVYRYTPRVSTVESGERNAAQSSSSKKNPESVVEKLTRMKPELDIPIVPSKGNRAPILLYTVNGELLDGQPAAICDIKGCRIAILGANISTTRTLDKSFNVWISGSEREGSKAENLEIKDTQGKVFFASKYQPPKTVQKTQQGTLARCRFHDFEFTLSSDTLRFTSRSRRMGIRLASTGYLILVDASTGQNTNHKMQPLSKREVLGKTPTALVKPNEALVEKLTKMKPNLTVKSESKPGTAPILLYTVEGKVLEGKSAAICDLNQHRIAILGADISTTRTVIKSLNPRVTGSEAEEQTVKDTQGKVFFASKDQSTQQSKIARCRFHKFEFAMSDQLLRYTQPGGSKHLTPWANPSNVGVLILVDSSTGKFTTHSMKPRSKRVILPGNGKREANGAD